MVPDQIMFIVDYIDLYRVLVEIVSYNRVLIIDLINYIPLFINLNDFLLTQ